MRTTDGKPLVRHYLSEWGHNYQSIQVWRELHGATERRGLIEFFAAHGICADCAGAGIDIVEEGGDPIYDICLTCSGGGLAERSKWASRSRQLYVRSRGRLLPYHPLESHGYSIQAIKEWRSHEHDAGRPDGLRDFYVTNGLCAECRGEGVHLDGKGELSREEQAGWPWLDPEDESYRGSGKAALH